MRGILLLIIVLIPNFLYAINIENAKRINRTCALCHGNYGQGTPGTLSPRLAGLPEAYLIKELAYYRDGVRHYAPMIVASSIKSMTDQDISDISGYLAGINLRNLNLPKIPEYDTGDINKGKKIFRKNCRNCHGKEGLGKPKKGAPPLAGQYGSYIFSQFSRFKSKQRYHDDDPEDDTFDDFSETDLDDIVAFLTQLPPHKPLDKPEEFAIGEVNKKQTASLKKSSYEVNIKTLNNIQGKFRVTPTGEIVLDPVDHDMRSIAGLRGEFKISAKGIIFTPKK